MAGIPTLDGPQLSPNALPTPQDQTRVSPDAFGAQTGQALEQLGGELADFAAQTKAKADAARVVAGEAQLGDQVNSLLFDPKTGFVTKKGTDAMAAHDAVVKQLATSRKQILDSLANDDQRNAFLARSNGTLEGAIRHVETHTSQQADAAAGAAYQAREATSYNTLANVAADPIARAAEMDQMHDVIVSRARSQGAGADVLRAMLAGYEQNAHATVLDQMLAKQQATAAKTYFEANKLALGTKADDYEKRVREVGVAQQGEQLARALLTDPSNRIKGTVLPDPAAISAKVSRLQVPIEVKDATLQRALHYADLVTKSKDAQNAQAFGQAMVQLDKNGVVDPNLTAYLGDQKNGAGHYFDAINQLSRRNLEQAISGPPSVDQEASFGRARLSIGADNREFWATQSYEQMAARFAPQVTRSQLQVLSNELDEVHKWSQDQNRVDRSAAIQQQVKDRLIKSSGFNKDQTKWTDDQWTIYSRALTDVKTQQQSFMANKQGAAPTSDDVKKWIDKPLAKVKVQNSGWLWDDSPVRAAADTLPQYQGKKTIYVIPSHERTLIDTQIQKAGKPLTDENRQAIFKQRHGL